jgi:IclR family transcriptional regulator, blcABC operon repressor
MTISKQQTMPANAKLKTIQPAKLVPKERGVPALVRGFRVLDAVTASRQPLTVTDLARRLDLPKSTVHGLCTTLVDLNLLARRNGTSFCIGPHVMHWASGFLGKTDLITEFAALWDNLSVLADETITLSVLDGPEVVYIACRNSASPLGITFRIGMRLPAPFTATGKAILSTMSDRRVREVVSGPWPQLRTRHSVSKIEALLRELEECRLRGFSIDNEQTLEGMYCFGTPVRDSTNLAVAGIAVSVLATRVNKSMIEHAAQGIKTMAEELSRRLGANPVCE